MLTTFKNRKHAGQELAKMLVKTVGRDDVVVLGLPRGGVPVAAEIAAQLDARLDTFIVRKLGVPNHEELAMGAIASNNARILNYDIINALGIEPETIAMVAEQERRELHRREVLYRGDRPNLSLAGKTVILVDDGLATGSTMKVAIQGIKQSKPSKIIVALPVGAEEGCREVARMVDELICLITPSDFGAVGLWYDEFGQTSDKEVQLILQEADKQLAL